MKRYDSYKDSGVEWIGDIPINWTFVKLGYLGSLKSGNGFSETLQGRDVGGDYPFFKVSDTNNFGNEELMTSSNNYVTEEEYSNNKWNLFDKNTIVFPKIGMVLLMNKRRILGQPSFIDNNMMGFTPNKKIHYQFSYYLFKMIDFKDYCSDGTIPSIGGSQISPIKIPLPPLSEQQQIVSFLDSKTSLIDSLIEKTQQKIELLKEKRTSLINEVVTKGLNPNVEMKDSGVEWIGEIPKGWRIGKLYQYSEMSNGSTPSRDKPEYWENGTIPWMSSGEINKKKIRDIDGRITQEGFENSSTKILPIGTVMMGLNGQGKTKGTVGILEIETTCNQSLCGMIFKDDMYPMFSYYFLDSQYYHIRGLVGEGQREGISVSFLGRYPLVVPPISEQQQIVEYLDEQTQLIDITTSIEEKRIELLKEYRQSLISEVVTGKRKVVE